MSNYSVANPYPVILNQIGGGLNGGKVYIGQPNQDPETFPVTVYWDAAGAIVASQPLSVIGGYIRRDGSPAEVFGPVAYSIRVRDRFNQQIFYAPNVNTFISDFVSELQSDQGAGLIGTTSGSTVQQLLRYVAYEPFSMLMGYDRAAEEAAAIKIGANTAFDGVSGALQVGGAGPKDSGNGAYIVNDGHPNWNVLQSSIPFNPTEWNIYGNGVGGVAVSTGTTTLTRSTGSAWGSFMNGLLLWFDGIAYTVVSATANSAILDMAPPADTATWHHVYTTGAGTCTVAGGVCTRIKGDPFIPHTFTTDTFAFWLNGSPYTVTASNGGDSCTVSSPPADGTYAYSYRTNINNQVATWRLHLTAGGSEENFTGCATPFAYIFGTQQSGSGKHRDVYFTSEYQAVIGLAAAGKFVSLGGPQNSEAMRVLWSANAVNRFDVFGSVAGVGPTLRSRGVDANVGMGIDMKGDGSLTVTNESFGGTVFKANRSAGVPDYPELNAGNGVVVYAAKGVSADIDILLSPKGTGGVRLGGWTGNGDASVNGYITVKDAAGNTRKLATIA